MPIEKGYRRKRTNENDRKKEKNCKIGIFGITSDFIIIIIIIIGGLDFNILVRRLETRNFVLWNSFVLFQVRIFILIVLLISAFCF